MSRVSSGVDREGGLEKGRGPKQEVLQVVETKGIEVDFSLLATGSLDCNQDRGKAMVAGLLSLESG